MFVIEEIFVLFILIIEFLTVRVSGLLCNGFKVLKFFGRSLESFMNLLLMIFFIGLVGISWIEFIVVFVEIVGKFNICGTVASVIVGVESVFGGDILGFLFLGDVVIWVDDSEVWAF